MNAPHDLERRLTDHYGAEAPRRAPDRVLHAALATIDTTRQRRVLIRAPWRYQTMNTFARAAIAVAAIAVGVLVLAVIGGAGARRSRSCRRSRPSPTARRTSPIAISWNARSVASATISGRSSF